MSLDPAVLAFLGRPPATASLKARPVRGYAGSICEQPNQHTKENDMPRGVYERKPKETPTQPQQPESTRRRKKKPAPAKKPRKASRRARPKLVMTRVPGPRFGVFEDGSVEVRLPDCRGTISGDDAAALHAFITKLRG